MHYPNGNWGYLYFTSHNKIERVIISDAQHISDFEQTTALNYRFSDVRFHRILKHSNCHLIIGSLAGLKSDGYQLKVTCSVNETRENLPSFEPDTSTGTKASDQIKR